MSPTRRRAVMRMVMRELPFGRSRSWATASRDGGVQAAGLTAADVR
jgi:hypothetical protein